MLTSSTQSKFAQLWAAAVAIVMVSLLFYIVVAKLEQVTLRRFHPEQTL